MKNLRVLTPLFAVLLTFSAALAQTDDARITPDDLSHVVARCQYSPKDSTCFGLTEHLKDKSPDPTLAQRRFPGPPRYPRGPMGHPYPSYPPTYWGPGYNNHAGIGAAIGFGLGAAAGASANTDAKGRVAASLIIGSLGALMGAAVGHGIPTFRAFHPRRAYPPTPWPDDDEIASRARAAHPDTSKQTPAVTPSAAVPPPEPPSNDENPGPTVP